MIYPLGLAELHIGEPVDHTIDADGGFCNVCRTAVVRINHEWRHEHETDTPEKETDSLKAHQELV